MDNDEITHYFATDGNYGDASGIVVVNTSKWTNQDWELVDETMDYERPQIAKQISEGDK